MCQTHNRNPYCEQIVGADLLIDKPCASGRFMHENENYHTNMRAEGRILL